MAKFYGVIGFVVQEETRPGIWIEVEHTRHYYGELLRNARRLQNSGQVLDDLTVSNEISLIADPYAQKNFHCIRYAEFMGAKWKVSNVEVRYPRLILTLGGVYNGETGPSDVADGAGGTPRQP